jgi:Tfp pilus assembly protein PilP
MLRVTLFALLLFAGCSQGPDADLPSISEARSLAAEWALVNGQAAQGHLTETYTHTMRQQLREQLRITASSLSKPNSSYGDEIRALLALPDEANPDALKRHSDKLKRIEESLESA